MHSEPDSPVLDRLAVVDAKWLEFVESSAVVLCCVASPGDQLLIDAFVRLEEDPKSCNHPDLFLRFSDALVGEGVGTVLRDSLIARYERERADLEALGSSANWVTPPTTGADVQDLIAACESYHAYHGIAGRLVLVVQPETIDDLGAWRRSVAQFASCPSNGLALVVLDSPRAPGLADLDAELPGRVSTWWANLEFAAMLSALAASTDAPEGPAGKFRSLSTQVSAAVLDGNIVSAEQAGDAAVELAVAHGWPHLACGIELTLGAALSGDSSRLDDALSRLRAAEQAAIASEAAEEPGAPLLRVRARMAQGPLLLDQHKFAAAATLFEETAPLAQSAAELRACIDCWRLASLAYELDGNSELAWERGMQGLDVVRVVDQETRETSSFAYLGVSLTRLGEARQDPVLVQRLERELCTIAGRDDWRPSEAGNSSNSST